MSDYYGRKNVLTVTVLFSLIGYLIFGFSDNLTVYLIGRFIAGIGAAGFAVAQAYISDISTPQERTKNMALMGAMFGIGFMVAPVL